jgi:hypothetical protein
MYKWSLLLCCLTGTLHGEEYAYFNPPQEWKVIEHVDSLVKITFVGKPKKNCNPLINLATEKVSISLKEYVSIVQKNCEADPNREWRDLGHFSTLAGQGRLIEIIRKTTGGDLSQLQLILVKNGSAYVITTSCAKEEFLGLSHLFYTTLKSFTVTSDLIQVIKKKEEKEKLTHLYTQALKDFPKEIPLPPTKIGNRWKNALLTTARTHLFLDKKFQKEAWLPLEKTILHNYAEMGNYWKILLLKDIKNKLISPQDLNYAQDKDFTDDRRFWSHFSTPWSRTEPRSF